MNTRFISAYIATATLFSVVALSGCRGNQALPDPDHPTVTQPESEDGVITLAEPVTLTIGVVSQQVVDPFVPTRSIGDFYHSYTDEERQAATVNTLKENDKFVRDGYWGKEGGTDWIRTLTISGLIEGRDYEVSGLVSESTKSPGSNGTINYRTADDDEIVPKSQVVTLTLYGVPKDKKLCFYINSEGWEDVFNQDERKSADNDQPYLSAYNGSLLRPLATFIEKPGYVDTQVSPCVFNSFYLPMYGEVMNVEIRDGKLYGTQFGDTTPGELKTIYVERAVAQVQIDWKNYEGNDLSKPSSDYIFGYFRPGWFVNAMSVRPNNYDGLLNAGKTLCLPPYQGAWDIPQGKGIYNQTFSATAYFLRYKPSSLTTWEDKPSSEGISTQYRRIGSENFFVPENVTALGQRENTLRVVVWKVDHKTQSFVKDDEGKVISKVFDLKYGTKVGNRYEVHRNTLYRLHLRFGKKAPDGTEQPYIVESYTEVDIPAEL